LNLPLEVNEPENIEEQDPEIEFKDSEIPTSKTKAKLAKIINDLTKEKHNFPLRKLQEEFQDNPMISKEIREQIKSSLGSTRTNKIWK
ncbi:25161_t:CDS:2, partial [Gigaspora rosea]